MFSLCLFSLYVAAATKGCDPDLGRMARTIRRNIRQLNGSLAPARSPPPCEVAGTLGSGSRPGAGASVVIARLVGSGHRLPVHLAVPTTLAGAEFAHYFGITETHGEVTVKRSQARRETTPAAVVLDAALTAAAPHRLWAGSGIKVLDHAVETLLNNPPRPILDAVCLQGIRRMASSLVPSTRPGPESLPFRQDAQLAAWECYPPRR
jgi:hypothetical protein